MADDPARLSDEAVLMAALENRLIAVTERAERSVVSIARVRERTESPLVFDPARRDNPAHPEFVPEHFGTGVVIAAPDGSRVILTAAHVVRGGPAVEGAVHPPAEIDSRLYVRLAHRRGGEAKILASDPRSDLAVLRVDPQLLEDIPAITFCKRLPEASRFRKGRMVLLLGNPYAIARDGSASVGWGLIANTARRPQPLPFDPFAPLDRTGETLHHLGTLLQLDARLHLGTSGGPVLNLNGELIGLTTSLTALQGYEQSSGFAIAFDDAMQRVVADLAAGREAEYGFLGVTPEDRPVPMKTQRLAGVSHPTAAFVRSVYPGSPADRAGVQSEDLILSVNDVPVRGADDLMREIGEWGPSARANETTPLFIWRGRENRAIRVSVRLDKWPVRADERLAFANFRDDGGTGLHLDYPTGRSRYVELAGRPYDRGVLVLEISDRSPFRGLLEPGDLLTTIDRQPVGTPAELLDLLPETGMARLTVRDKPDLVIRRTGDNWTVQSAP